MIFDPFSDSFDANTERLRFSDGKIVKESYTIRAESSWFSRLIKRKQYSQAAILSRLQKEYKLANKEEIDDKIFISNYSALIEKADQQNIKYKNSFCLIRWFKGKTEIPLKTHRIFLNSLQNSEHQPLLEFLSQEFKDYIFSDACNEEERKIVNTYLPELRQVDSKEWIDANTTLDYLKFLSIQFPEYTPFPKVQQYRINEKYGSYDFEKMLDGVIEFLPATLNNEPSLFGHALQVNGNHRTSFIIDLKNRTVEYYNSFGSDAVAKKPLGLLVELLNEKYGENFTYCHKTKNCHLQKDGYECGIWSGILIEERVKNGPSFDPKSVEFAGSRRKMLVEAFEYHMYTRIGDLRLVSCIEENFKDNIDEMYSQAFSSVNNRYHLLYNWGKTGEMPDEIPDIVNQLKS